MDHEIPDGDEKLFLECFPSYKLHSKPQSLDDDKLWVFSSNSCSSSDKVISAFSMLELEDGCIVQLWAPVTIGGRLLLSISAQPFAVSDLDECFMRYRQRCEEYGGYSNGPPLSAFFSRLPEILFLKSDHQEAGPLRTSWMIPIFDPFESSSTSSDCIGVVEYSLTEYVDLTTHFGEMNRALEKVGLRVFNVQDRIPYKTISGLKPTKEEIEKALETICESHHICLAQVWISSEDNNHEHFSSSLMGTQMKQMLALKLTGYTSVDAQFVENFWQLMMYYEACDKIPLKQGDELVLKTFEDYEPRFYKDNSNLGTDILLDGFNCDIKCSGLTIRMRSIDTSDFDYAFEFIWYHHSNYVMFLEALLLTLKRCLPRFKCASGAELGDELRVIDVDNSTKSEPKTFKIFQENRSSPIPEAVEKGKKAMIVDHRANTEVNCKTAKKDLPREVIEQQFGNTLKVAAENLKVSLSTLKRKLKVYGITEWQGPDLRKRKVYDSFNNQNCTNEKDYGAIQDPLSINRDENTLTIKAEYADDMIKFDLPISEATFDTV